jgi:tetratricopeptide (TPR) repeat protein
MIYKRPHRDIASVLNNIATTYTAKFAIDSAIYYQWSSIKVVKQLFGDNHSFLGQAYYNLARDYRFKKEHDTALKYCKMAMAIHDSAFGTLNPHRINLLDELGINLLAKSDFEGARASFFDELNLALEIYRPNHPAFAAIYNSIAHLFLTMGEFKIAAQLLSSSIQITKINFDDNHPAMATYLGNWGLALAGMGDTEQGIKYLIESAAINESYTGSCTLPVAERYRDISLIYFDKKEFFLAYPYARKALLTFEEFYENDHQELMQMIQLLKIIEYGMSFQAYLILRALAYTI